MEKVMYLSGKITGENPVNAASKFFKAEEFAMARGFDFVNPLESVPVKTFNETPEERKHNLTACIKELLKCDAIVMCHDYKNSPGAMLEYHIAKELGLLIFYIDFNGNEIKPKTHEPVHSPHL